MNIAIIGGGIGGLALANCFQKFKIPYTLYERSSHFGEVGAGIGISESTITILNSLGLESSLKQKGKNVKNILLVNKKAKLIRKLPLNNAGFCIHRYDLITVLSENLNKNNLKLGYEVDSFNQELESVKLHFKNGQSQVHDYVFACDGIDSIFRKKLIPSIEKRYSGQTVWRGIANCKLPECYKTAYTEFWGDNLRFATIPLKRDDSYYWYACKNAKANDIYDDQLVKEELKVLFKGFDIEIQKVINSTTQILRNDMWDLKPHHQDWHQKNIIFLGDSIHATTPNLAQGGCQAIEDAYTIAKLIALKGTNDNTFKLYRNLRIKKVNYIVNQSWKYGKISHQKNKISEMIMQYVFKLLPNSYFINQYRKISNIDYLGY